MASAELIASLKKLSISIAKLTPQVGQFSEDVHDARQDMDELSGKLESLETCIDTLQTDLEDSTVQYSDRQRRHLKIMLDESEGITKRMATLLTSLISNGEDPDTLWTAAPRELLADLLQSLEEDRSSIALVIKKQQNANSERERASRNRESMPDTASMLSETGTLPPVPYAREDPFAKPGEAPDPQTIRPQQTTTMPMTRLNGRVENDRRNSPRSGTQSDAHTITESPQDMRSNWQQPQNARQQLTSLTTNINITQRPNSALTHPWFENQLAPHETPVIRHPSVPHASGSRAAPDEWTNNQLIYHDKPFEQQHEGNSDKQVVPSNVSIRSARTVPSISEASTRESTYFQLEKGTLDEINITAALKARNRLTDSEKDKRDKDLLKRVKEGASMSKIESSLDAGADPNASGPRNTVLTTEIQYSGRQEVIELLLRRGAEPNATSDGIPEHKIIKGGNLERLKSNLGVGGSIDAVPYRVGVLFLAAMHTNRNVVKLLVSYGAALRPHAVGALTTKRSFSPNSNNSKRPSIVRKDSSGPRSGDHGSAILIAAEKDKWDIVQLLALHGADPNETGGKYWSTLQIATARNEKDIMQILISQGADVNAQGGQFGCALIAAAYESHPRAAKILLDADANINICHKKIGTALNAAVLNGSLNVVKLLLDQGADMKLSWPLDTALQRLKDDPENSSRKAIVRALEAKGAKVGPADKKVPEWAGLFSETY